MSLRSLAPVAVLVLMLTASCSTRGSFSRVDVSGKPQVEIVGAGAARIQIKAEKNYDSTSISYPNTDTFVSARFEKDHLNELLIVTRSGDTKTVLRDEDGDGLPDWRMTIQVFSNGSERATKFERLTWASKETAPDLPAKPRTAPPAEKR